MFFNKFNNYYNLVCEKPINNLQEYIKTGIIFSFENLTNSNDYSNFKLESDEDYRTSSALHNYVMPLQLSFDFKGTRKIKMFIHIYHLKNKELYNRWRQLSRSFAVNSGKKTTDIEKNPFKDSSLPTANELGKSLLDQDDLYNISKNIQRNPPDTIDFQSNSIEVAVQLHEWEDSEKRYILIRGGSNTNTRGFDPTITNFSQLADYTNSVLTRGDRNDGGNRSRPKIPVSPNANKPTSPKLVGV